MPNNQPTTSQEDNDHDTIVTLETPTTPTCIQDQEESSSESTLRRIRSCNLAILELGTFVNAAKQEEWVKAIEEEIKTIDKNNTWELSDCQMASDIIKGKWVFKAKLNLNGTVQKHKARVVAKGDNVVVDAIKLILLNYSNVNIAKIVVNKIDRVK